MLRRGSGNAASAIVSMESRPTSPAPRSSELSSLRSLQLSSSFRGDVRPDSAIVNPCSQRAGRQALLPLNNAGACVYGVTSTVISTSSASHASAQFRGGRPPLNELPPTHIADIVNAYSFARSGTGVIRCTRHRAGRLPPHDPVYRPSGRALHPELPRPSRRRPSHSLGKHPVGRASMKAGNIVNPCSHVRSGDGCPQGRAQADRS